MSPAISTKPKTRGRFVLSVSVCLGLLVLTLAMFPTLSGAKFESPTASPTQSRTKTKRTRPQRFVPGEVLVRYRSEPTAKSKSGSRVMSTREGRAVSLRVEDFGVSDFIHGLRMARVAEADTLAAVEALQRDPDVVYAEPNYIYRAAVTNPNDTHFAAGRQTNLTQIGLPFAWDSTQGSDQVVVAVLDQGINTTHEDFGANIWQNPQPGAAGMGITNDVNGYNFVANTGTVFSGMDAETHATHVAGIIGARGNNVTGISGVNWSVKLMSLKFLDEEGFGSSGDAVRACAYAKRMRELWDEAPVHTKGANIKIINASFGEKSFSQTFLSAINELNDIGPTHAQILFVAAAGNIGDGTPEPNNDLVPEYPASYNAPNVIAVGSVDANDSFSTSFSHFGPTSVDLAAPGEGTAGAGLLSTTPPCSNPNGPNCSPLFPPNPTPTQSTYSLFRGTSVSAPHVSGVAALLFAESINLNLNLTAVQAKNLLLMNGDVQPSLIDKTLTGRRLNAETSMLALQELPQLDLAAPGAVTNLHINSQNGRTLSLGWTSSGDDGDTGTASLYEVDFVEGSNVTPLKGVVPIASGGGQIANVTVPFRHTSGSLRVRAVDNVGKETLSTALPVGIPLSSADPYAISDPGGQSPALTTGGTNLTDVIQDPDDSYVPFNFPAGFTFPFFGSSFDKVTLSTNGSLYFTPPVPPDRDDGSADDVPSSPGALGGLKMIAGLWDDLDLSQSARADAGIWMTRPNASTIIFRWQGVPCNFVGTQCTGTTPVNFEVELQTNGVIKIRYGTGNTSLFPTVGIGGGEQDGYVITSHSWEEPPTPPRDLNRAGEVTFTPRAATVSTVQLSQGNFSLPESQASLPVTVTRSGDTTGVTTVDYATSDTAGAAQCTTVGNAASSRCDYLTSKGTLTFAPGETTGTISIPILDDNYDENDETFTLTLSSPTGATLGTQTSATLTINDNDTGNPTNNPIDTASFFVRQHYVDFLNREPDAGGLAFWTNEITQCGADAQCLEAKRVNVSAAFFLAIEFQETGYLVYRIYKSGLTNLTIGTNLQIPALPFTDFLRDTQQIGKGVQVGIGPWREQLEANKQAYALAFVQRPDFQAAFPSTMSSAAFVQKLIDNAGPGVIQPGERTSLEGVLGNIPFDLSRRAAVLRAVAEDSDLRAAEFNKAFVLMQYFGYLRRSPNDPPDNDFGGYQFWLNKLNDAGGDFVRPDMVKSFIVSGEYRHRFGP